MNFPVKTCVFALVAVLLLFAGTRVGAQQQQAQPPSDLYPIISPLFGGNSYATAHPNDYDIARDPNEVPSTPLAAGSAIQFFVSEINTVVAPMNQQANPPVWSGNTDVRFNYFAFGAVLPSGTVAAKVP